MEWGYKLCNICIMEYYVLVRMDKLKLYCDNMDFLRVYKCNDNFRNIIFIVL